MAFLLDIQEMEGEAPDALLSRPKLLFGQAHYLSAFETLSEWRGVSDMGQPKPLSLMDVKDYCDLFDIKSPEMKATLVHHIRRLDDTYLNIVSKSKDNKSDNSDIPEAG